LHGFVLQGVSPLYAGGNTKSYKIQKNSENIENEHTENMHNAKKKRNKYKTRMKHIRKIRKQYEQIRNKYEQIRNNTKHIWNKYGTNAKTFKIRIKQLINTQIRENAKNTKHMRKQSETNTNNNAEIMRETYITLYRTNTEQIRTNPYVMNMLYTCCISQTY
jgi:hypothetical protein